MNADGSKMSKRKGDVQVFDYKVCSWARNSRWRSHNVISFQKRGWEPTAVLNWLALAGWGQQVEAGDSGATKAAPDSTAVMTLSDMIREVDSSLMIVCA